MHDHSYVSTNIPNYYINFPIINYEKECGEKNLPIDEPSLWAKTEAQLHLYCISKISDYVEFTSI